MQNSTPETENEVLPTVHTESTAENIEPATVINAETLPNNHTTSVILAETIVHTEAIPENKPTKKPKTVKTIVHTEQTPPKKQKKPVNKPESGGKSIGVRVSEEENAYLETILAARVKDGLSRNMSHMLRQMINYAANWQTGWRFGVPVPETKVFFDK